MEKRFFKILSIVTITVPVVFVLMTYVYFNLIFDADSLRKEISIHLEKNIPNVYVSIESVSLKARSALRLRLNEILIRDSVNGKPVFTTRSVTARLPFTAFFLGVGPVNLILERPQVFHNEINNEERISLLFKNLKNNKQSIPFFLKKTNISLSAHNALVEYALGKSEGKSGIVGIDKILLKNIGINTNSALEIKTRIKTQDLESDLMLVGSFNLNEYVEKKELKLKSALSFKNIFEKKLNVKIPNLSLKMDTVITNLGTLNGVIEGKYEKSSVKFAYNWDQGLFDLNFKDTTVFIEDFVSYQRANYAGQVEILGTIGNKETNNIKLIVKNVNSRFHGRILETTGEIGLNKKEFLVSLKSELDDQKFILIKAKGRLNEANLYVDNAIVFDGVAFSLEDIKAIKKIIKSGSLIGHNIFNKLTFRNSKFLNTDLLGKAKFDIVNNKWSIEKVLIKYGAGDIYGDINYNDQKDRTLVNVQLENVQLKFLTKTFLKDSESLSGLATGKVKGHIKQSDLDDYKLDIVLDVTNGHYFNKKLESNVAKIERNLKSLDIYKRPIQKYINGHFDNIQIESVLDDEVHYYKKVKVDIVKNSLSLDAKGSIFLKKNAESEIYVSLKDKVGLSQISEDVTFLLTGKKYRISPNYNYTMSKLIKKPLKRKRQDEK